MLTLNINDLKRCVKYAAATAKRTRCFKVAAQVQYGIVPLESVDLIQIALDACQAGTQLGIFCASHRVFFKEQK